MNRTILCECVLTFRLHYLIFHYITSLNQWSVTVSQIHLLTQTAWLQNGEITSMSSFFYFYYKRFHAVPGYFVSGEYLLTKYVHVTQSFLRYHLVGQINPKTKYNYHCRLNHYSHRICQNLPQCNPFACCSDRLLTWEFVKNQLSVT